MVQNSLEQTVVHYGYILVPEMAVLVQVAPVGILCYADFFCVHDVFWVARLKNPVLCVIAYLQNFLGL